MEDLVKNVCSKDAKLSIGAMVSALAFGTTTAQADVRATKCPACTEMQLEQKAIGLGIGTKYLYDLTASAMRAFYVSREPNASGGYVYDVYEVDVEPAYQAIFQKAKAVYASGGTLARSVVLGLPGAPNTSGHSTDSVFGLFNSSNGSTIFGDWLGAYFSQQNIPVSVPQGTVELTQVILANPTVEFTGDEARVDVTVTFKDGRAEFVLSKDQKRYTYVSGSARDSNGNVIPETKSQVSPYPYSIPGGENNPSYGGWGTLMQYWGVPTGAGGWKCGVASGGGSSSYTCVLER